MTLTMTKRVLITVLVIFVGLIVFLQNSGVVASQTTRDSLGSVLVMGLGLFGLAWNPRRNWPWALIIFLVGKTDLIENQQWPMFEAHTPWEYVWPVFVILIGCQVLISRRKSTKRPADVSGKQS